MFSQASVILFTGGVSQHALGQTPPLGIYPLPDRHPPGRHTPSPRRPLQRTVRILLKCILVSQFKFSFTRDLMETLTQ